SGSGHDRANREQDDARTSPAGIRIDLQRAGCHGYGKCRPAAVSHNDDFLVFIRASCQLYETLSACFNRPVETGLVAASKLTPMRIMAVDLHHPPATGGQPKCEKNCCRDDNSQENSRNERLPEEVNGGPTGQPGTGHGCPEPQKKHCLEEKQDDSIPPR